MKKTNLNFIKVQDIEDVLKQIISGAKETLIELAQRNPYLQKALKADLKKFKLPNKKYEHHLLQKRVIELRKELTTDPLQDETVIMEALYAVELSMEDMNAIGYANGSLEVVACVAKACKWDELKCEALSWIYK